MSYGFRARLALLPVFAAALVVAGCSSSTDVGSSGSSSLPTASSTVPGPSTPAVPPAPQTEVPQALWSLADAMSELVGTRVDGVDMAKVSELQEALPFTSPPGAANVEPLANFFLLSQPSDGGEGPPPSVPPVATEVRGFGSPDAVYCVVRPGVEGPYVAVAGGCGPLFELATPQDEQALALAAASGIVRAVTKNVPLPWTNPVQVKEAAVSAGALGFDQQSNEIGFATRAGLYAVTLDMVTGSVASSPREVAQFPPAANGS